MDKIKRKILIDKKDIEKRVKELAREISNDHKGKNPLFVGILKGSFIFLADLIREIDPDINPQVDFVAISSYGTGTVSSKDPKWEKNLSKPVTGRNVVLVEDIVDTGYSFLNSNSNVNCKRSSLYKNMRIFI
jgi:hypoxanthine phosphoribosyltransferase